jgi:hypothetical protein
MKEKVILTDVDGVLLDWVYSFDQWMKRHGYVKSRNDVYDLNLCYNIDRTESKMLVRMFNESANIGYLPPLRDAVKYVRKLHEEHGFIFHAITSLSLDPFAAKEREDNLKRVFGETVFEKIQCLDTGADKDEALEMYRDTGCFWIEDKTINCDLGITMGLEGVLMEHDHNKDYSGDAIVVKKWKDIYDMITE